MREIVRYPNGDVLHCYSLLFEVVIGFDDIGPAQVARYEVHPFVEHLLDDGSSELVALGDYEGRKAADLRALFAAIFPS